MMKSDTSTPEELKEFLERMQKEVDRSKYYFIFFCTENGGGHALYMHPPMLFIGLKTLCDNDPKVAFMMNNASAVSFLEHTDEGVKSHFA